MLRRSARHAAPSDQAITDNTLGTIYTNPPPQHDEPEAADKCHFLRLPAELRNVVYCLAFAAETKHDISCFSTPALTKVSKQLRAESLPLFFAETVFNIPIGANFQYAYFRRNKIQSRVFGNIPGHMNMAGAIIARPWPGETHSKAMLFRNVVFEVYDTLKIWKDDSGVLTNSKRDVYLVIHVKVGAQGRLEASVQNGSVTEQNIRNMRTLGSVAQIFTEKLQDIERAGEKAEDIARDIAAPEGFKGFKMEDLQRIAAAFKIE